jgi:glutaredoxin
VLKIPLRSGVGAFLITDRRAHICDHAVPSLHVPGQEKGMKLVASAQRWQVPAQSRPASVLRWLLVALCLLGALPDARGQSVTSPSAGAEPRVLVVFVRTGCPHCADAKVFLAGMAADRPWLGVVYRVVDQDRSARDDLHRIFRELGIWPPGVPTFVMNGQVLVGFDDSAHAGVALRNLIDTGAPPPDRVETGLFGTLSASRLGLPLFTLALGLLDGVNPCAMWVLLFLLSLLVRLQSRRRMALIAGTFVLVSGAVYYAFMAAWLNVFLLVGMSAALRWILGGVAFAIGGFNLKDFFAWGRGFSLSIPASAKPGLYARARAVLYADALLPSLVAVTVLAAAVNVIELLCTAGLPAIYTAVLTQQALGAPAYYAYLGLYIVGYVADDSAMVATAVIALSSRKLTDSAGRRLKLLSGVVMLALGAVFLLRPQWLM